VIARALDVREAVEIVERLAQAKNRQDLAATMAVYHPDAVLESPSLGSRYVGPEIDDAITGWFAFAPDYEVRLDGHGLDESLHFDVAGVAPQCGVEATALVGVS
jgi:ketosteroid isomerase-like protein